MKKSLDAVFFPEKVEPFLNVAGKEDFEQLWLTNRPWVLSNIAHAAYHHQKNVQNLMDRFGANRTSFYDRKGAQAFLSIWPDKAILSFRGTQPIEMDKIKKDDSFRKNIKNLLHLDLDADFLKLLSNDILADLRFKLTQFDDYPNVEVHHGFLLEIDKLWKTDILPDLELYANGLPIWATGHSLGGAMAALAGMRFPFEAVMTFGEPRVGRNLDIAFKAKKHTRYVNGDDPVTKVPPDFPFGYQHHGDELLLSDFSGKSNPLFDHAIVYYSENLQKT